MVVVITIIASTFCVGCGPTNKCSSNAHSSTNCYIGNFSPPQNNSPYSSPGAFPPSSAPNSGSAGAYRLIYHRVLINMPPGTCTDQTSVDFDYPTGPKVNPTNLFNNSSNNDLEMDNCANPTQDQTLKSEYSSISTDIAYPITAGDCATAIEQRPDGTSLVPRSLMLQRKKHMCLQTSDGNIVLLDIKSLAVSPFKMQVYATAWQPNS